MNISFDPGKREIRLLAPHSQNPEFRGAMTVHDVYNGLEFIRCGGFTHDFSREVFTSCLNIVLPLATTDSNHPISEVKLMARVGEQEIDLSTLGICPTFSGVWSRTFCVPVDEKSIKQLEQWLLMHGNADTASKVRELAPEFFPTIRERLARLFR